MERNPPPGSRSTPARPTGAARDEADEHFFPLAEGGSRRRAGDGALPDPGDRIRRTAPREDGTMPDWIYPLAEPNWLDARRAAGVMRPDDAVLGIEMAGGAWALPWWIMKNHHVANLVLNGRPVLVTLCEVCSSSAAFDPVIDGRRHTFRLEGLYNGTIMPTDYETGSLWTGFTGESFDGPLKGRTMERLPLLQCTWAEWVEMHPDSLVPDGADESREGHGEGQTPGSPVLAPGMRKLLPHVDLRLPHYELVLGAALNGQSRCYPLRMLATEGPAINDSLGGEPIAVFSRPGTWMAIAYFRELNGRPLTFRGEGGVIVDEQTGSRWELSGACRAGQLKGARLRYVHSGIEEFFIWAAFFPATEIFNAPGAARTSRLDPGVWTVDLYPEAVHRAVRSWWTLGMKVLHVGCGDGLISASMAERGMNVYAVDADSALVAEARRAFRGVVRLEFDVADVRHPHAFGQRFEAALDHGLFARLAPRERETYAANLAAACAPGGLFLLLVPGEEENLRRIHGGIRRLFGAEFKLIGLRPLSMPDPVTGVEVPSGAFGLVRNG